MAVENNEVDGTVWEPKEQWQVIQSAQQPPGSQVGTAWYPVRVPSGIQLKRSAATGMATILPSLRATEDPNKVVPENMWLHHNDNQHKTFLRFAPEESNLKEMPEYELKLCIIYSITTQLSALERWNQDGTVMNTALLAEKTLSLRDGSSTKLSHDLHSELCAAHHHPRLRLSTGTRSARVLGLHGELEQTVVGNWIVAGLEVVGLSDSATASPESRQQSMGEFCKYTMCSYVPQAQPVHIDHPIEKSASTIGSGKQQYRRQWQHPPEREGAEEPNGWEERQGTGFQWNVVERLQEKVEDCRAVRGTVQRGRLYAQTLPERRVILPLKAVAPAEGILSRAVSEL
ncbi:hypothetical protein FB45DRAFT_874165 [Roridomyces roridus]|uniref:Uncharacterized protein n=1 Tax=Roridomyces roridus TaxID=1738132 RepID=A0AAD7B8G1_9AGAR|nr:hypothetical protein FB45DRAFT_874165 [Roridomyces roridus]